jgi:hypothetical protein
MTDRELHATSIDVTEIIEQSEIPNDAEILDITVIRGSINIEWFPPDD